MNTVAPAFYEMQPLSATGPDDVQPEPEPEPDEVEPEPEPEPEPDEVEPEPDLRWETEWAVDRREEEEGADPSDVESMMQQSLKAARCLIEVKEKMCALERRRTFGGLASSRYFHRLAEDLQATAEKLEHGTNTPLTIVGFGEGKNGKSTALNAILGDEILPSGSTTCTGNITMISGLHENRTEETAHLHRPPTFWKCRSDLAEEGIPFRLSRDMSRHHRDHRLLNNQTVKAEEHVGDWIYAKVPIPYPCDVSTPFFEPDVSCYWLPKKELQPAQPIDPRTKLATDQVLLDDRNGMPRVKKEWVTREGEFHDVEYVSVEHKHTNLQGGVTIWDVPGVNQDAERSKTVRQAIGRCHILLIICNASNGGLTETERNWLERWREATDPPQVFVICNKVDEVGKDPARIELEEAKEICRKYHPSWRKYGDDEAKHKEVDEMCLAGLAPQELDSFARQYKPPNLAPIRRDIEAALNDLFPQSADTPEGRRHANNIHFVRSDDALRAALKNEPQAQEFSNMRDHLFEIIERDKDLLRVDVQIQNVAHKAKKMTQEGQGIVDQATQKQNISEEKEKECKNQLKTLEDHIEKLKEHAVEALDKCGAKQIKEKMDVARAEDGQILVACLAKLDEVSAGPEQSRELKDAYKQWSHGDETKLRTKREQYFDACLEAGNSVAESLYKEMHETMIQDLREALHQPLLKITDLSQRLRSRDEFQHGVRELDMDQLIAEISTDAVSLWDWICGTGEWVKDGISKMLGIGKAAEAQEQQQNDVKRCAECAEEAVEDVKNKLTEMIKVEQKQAAERFLSSGMVERFTSFKSARMSKQAEFDERIADLVCGPGSRLREELIEHVGILKQRLHDCANKHQATGKVKDSMINLAWRMHCAADEANRMYEMHQRRLQGTPNPRTLRSSHFNKAYKVYDEGRVAYSSEHVELIIREFLERLAVSLGQRQGLPPEAKQAMSDDVEKFWERLKKQVRTKLGGEFRDSGIAQVAELLWTSDETWQGKEFCSHLNQALRDDPDDQLLANVTARVVRIMTSTNTAIRNPSGHQSGIPEGTPPDREDILRFPPEGVTWRGAGFDNGTKQFFTPGKRYRVPCFVASSFNKQVAERFRERAQQSGAQSTVMWKITVDPAGEHDPSKRCKHAHFVPHSMCENEEEYLFAPYSTFRVAHVSWAEDSTNGFHQIELVASTDNLKEPDDIPLAPWC